ncbi:putative bifunctional diguanylate cyclase/phosphodiesterase [Deinococcus sp.]|uniref:putative bifunctional diguanylate cyclase/phosphodiesterase n=1 Tax=Deinococcus sp. TaxID=47478 RepID=UPI003B58B5B5
MVRPPLEANKRMATEIEWRRPLLLALPTATVAFLVGQLLDVPSGQGNPFDHLFYPLALILLLLLSVSLWLFPKKINAVVTILVFAMSGFFLGKLIYILFFTSQTSQVQLQMTETFFWIPALQVLSFFIPNLRGARTVSITFFLLFFLVSVAYIAFSFFVKNPLGILYSLTELNLANLTLFVVTNTFIGFKDKYVRTVSEQERMREIIATDLLTGLPNRSQMNEVIEKAIADKRFFSLLFIDLDGFKVINDTLGHLVGDQVLIATAQRLDQRRSDGFFVARLSGDEFIALVFARPQEAYDLAGTLLTELAVPLVVDGHSVQLSASIGMSVYPDDGLNGQHLIHHADTAMYVVKTHGKHGLRRYEALTDSAIERLQCLERELAQALQANQLYLMYQPICSLNDGVVRKLETLLRWTHPTLGIISASEFIPLAENNGQIISVGAWALREACQQARRWNDLTGLAITVCVNVSPVQFIQTDFVDIVRRALADANLPAAALELELTESAVMRRLDIVKASLRELQALGVKIAIDDFGTGYSSLAYLRDLPINCIKIDKAFTNDLSSPRRAPQFALAIVEAVIGIADTLDLQVVAEGIETRKQMEMLRDLGCTLGQGYFLSPPLGADAALDTFITPVVVTLDRSLRDHH